MVLWLLRLRKQWGMNEVRLQEEETYEHYEIWHKR